MHIELPDSEEAAIREQAAARGYRDVTAYLLDLLARDRRRRARDQRWWDETRDALDQADRGRTVDGDRVLAWVRSWDTDAELPTPGPAAR
jgi:predicted transcriptional regulator